nr:MAG TPA: hypothetical protein [Caudoviricetes sp.]
MASFSKLASSLVGQEISTFVVTLLSSIRFAIHQLEPSRAFLSESQIAK